MTAFGWVRHWREMRRADRRAYEARLRREQPELARRLGLTA